MAFLYAIGATAIVMFLHWLTQFVWRRAGALPRFVLAFAGGFILLLVALIAGELPFVEALVTCIWFCVLCELYVFLFTLSFSSLSVKILQLLRSRPLAETEVKELYQPTGMVEIRFQRLLAAGLIQQEEKGMTLTEKGRRLVNIFGSLRNLFHCSKA